MDTPDVTTLKMCTQCHRTLPATLEQFYRLKNGRGGLHSWCKDCVRARSRLWANANPERTRANRRAWRKANPERMRAKKKRQYAANPERVLARNLAWRKANPGQVKVLKRAYRKRHPEVRKAEHQRRRSLELQAEGRHTATDIKVQVKAQTDKKGVLHCWWCSKKISGDYHVDHRIALAVGGTDWPDNLCISCPKCNIAKGTKSPAEFAGRLF